MKGVLHIHWLVAESQCLGAGHSTQLGPYLPTGQTHWFPFHNVVGAEHPQVLLDQTLGAGQGVQLSPKLLAGHEQVFKSWFHIDLGGGHIHWPLMICLGDSQQEHWWVTLSQVWPA